MAKVYNFDTKTINFRELWRLEPRFWVQKKWYFYRITIFLNIGAADENRTHTGYPIRPSNVRVYQFRHGRNCLIIINNIYINFQHYFLVFDYILCKRHIKRGFHRLKWSRFSLQLAHLPLQKDNNLNEFVYDI